VDPLVQRVRADLDRLAKDVRRTDGRNTVRFEGIEDGLQKANSLIRRNAREFSTKMEVVDARIDQCATKTALREAEAAIKDRIKSNEVFMFDVKKASTTKFEEMVSRLLTFQTLLEDHEHALQHQAEELLNRATTYDLMLVERRIDDCALREKVESDMKELQALVQWHSMKLERLSMQGGFGGGRKQRSSLNTQEGEGNAGQSEDGEHSQANTRPPSAMMFADVRFGGMNPTELLALLREQLERLAQGVLGLSHQVFRGVCQPASSREERQLREAELIHHLSCIVDWITHKRAPADWDKVKFTSLVMGPSVPDDSDRRRTPLHALPRGPATSQSTAHSQGVSASSSAITPAASPASPSSSPRPRQASAQHQVVEDPGTPSQGLRLEVSSSSARTTRRAGTPAAPRPQATEESAALSQRAGGVPAGGPGNTPRSGGGFRGRLAKTRIAATAGHHEAETRENPIQPASSEALPRLVVVQEGEKGGSRPPDAA